MAEFKVAPANASAGVKLLTWVDNRFPATKLWKEHAVASTTRRRTSTSGTSSARSRLLVLVIQIVTGIFLVMHYKPDATLAFASVEYIMRDVPWGWLVRYMHSTGASAFFIVVYLHMFRGLLYGSYRKPRELVWIFGCAHLPVPDGRGLHGLPAALGPDVVLGRAGDRQPVLARSRSSAPTCR